MPPRALSGKRRRPGPTVVSTWQWIPDTEVLLLVGSQEGTAHLPLAVLDPGDAALLLDPYYPSHMGGLRLASAAPVLLPLDPERGWRPDFDRLAASQWDALKLMVLGFPHNPTATTGEQAWLDAAVERALRHDVVLAHDNPYVDLALEGEAPALLRNAAWRRCGIEFFSFSKSWCLGGYRLAFAIGAEWLITALRQLKGVVDFNQSLALQAGAIAALEQAPHWPEQLRSVYRERRDRMADALEAAGMARGDVLRWPSTCGCRFLPPPGPGAWIPKASAPPCWRRPGSASPPATASVRGGGLAAAGPGAPRRRAGSRCGPHRRLAAPVLIGAISALRRRQLAADAPEWPADLLPWRLRGVPVCASTETVLDRWLAGDQDLAGDEPLPAPRAVIARRQRHGHGQRGRPWSSPAGGVWLSAALPWPPEPGTAASVGLAVAVGLCLRLETKRLPVRIKWPNDLVLTGGAGAQPQGGRGGSGPLKLAGLLPRLRLRGGTCRWARIGVGLNVANRVPPGAVALATPLSSLPGWSRCTGAARCSPPWTGHGPGPAGRRRCGSWRNGVCCVRLARSASTVRTGSRPV